MSERTLASLSTRGRGAGGADGSDDEDDSGGTVALRSVGDPDREYDYPRLRTDARKTGNFLAHRGVRAGRTLAVADRPVPETVLAVLAAGLLGAVVRVDPPESVDARAVVAPSWVVGEYDLPAGGQRIGYGSSPEDPAVEHFEEQMWSENPTFPPPSVDPEDPLLDGGDDPEAGGPVTHGEVMDAADGVVEGSADGAGGLVDDDVVAVRAPLSLPGTVVAGLVAPLRAGATVLLVDPEDPGSASGTVAVTADDGVPEDRRIDPRGLLDRPPSE